MDFFSILTGGTLWKSIKKNFNFFFEPRFFGYEKPSWGPLRRFFGEIWVGTTGGPHDFGPEPIWSKWLLTITKFQTIGVCSKIRMNWIKIVPFGSHHFVFLHLLKKIDRWHILFNPPSPPTVAQCGKTKKKRVLKQKWFFWVKSSQNFKNSI